MADEMKQAFKDAIAPLHLALNKLMGQAAEIKKTINNLSVMAGETPPFGDVETIGVSGTANISHDQFFGMPLPSATKSYLKMKGRAALGNEILAALRKGGFEIPKEWTDEKMYLKNLSIFLGKNSKDFITINTDEGKAYGLWEFYPERKKVKDKISKDTKEEVIEEDNQTINSKENKSENGSLEETTEDLNEKE